MVSRSIQDYWNLKAESMGVAMTATMRDIQLRWLEIELLASHLYPEDRVLDVGCGNGAATVLFAEKVSHIEGIDFSSQMIEQAKRLAEADTKLQGKVSFQVGNVLDLSAYSEGSFDAVISQRCLINLTSWTDQQQAIFQLARVLKPGGRLLMIEGTQQGLDRLNAARQMFDLQVIEKHWHNLLFDEAALSVLLDRHFLTLQVRGFGTYYFVSRIVHPLLVAPNEPEFEARINEIARKVASKLEGFDDISLNKLYVLRKY
jgi:ubiquinone/menaquinone biosynthesis C-methylase UbiE